MVHKPTYADLEKQVKTLEKETAALKKTEEALRESEEKYRLHFETVSDVIYSIDREFKIVSVTPSVEKITGYRPDELIGRSFVDFNILAPEYLEAAIEDTVRIIEGQEKIDSAVYEFIIKDGSRRVGEVSGSPLLKDGKIVGLVSVVRDITEHKQADEALRESEEKYRTILESIEDGYFEVDIAGNFTFFNDSMRRMLGYPAEELLGLNNRAYMDKENAKKTFQTFSAVYRTGISTKTFDWQLIRKDGSTCIIETIVSLIMDSNCQGTGFRGIARDVTEQKKAGEALQESEEQYKAIFDNTLDCIFLHDFEGNFIDANPAVFDLLGYSREELPTINLMTLLNREGLKKTIEDLKLMLKKGSHEIPSEYKVKKKDGTYIDMETKGSIIYRKGEPFAVMGMARDITKRKRTEQQLLRSEKLASLGNMVAGVAHEISTPLGVSLMSASYLNDTTLEFEKLYHAEKLASSEVEKFIKKSTKASSMVLSNLDRAANLLNSFKHVAVDQIIEERRHFNLKTNIKDTLNSLRPKYKRTAHTVTVECPNDLEIDSYPGTFSQIITNLLMNSLVHGFDGIDKGRVIITFEKKENMLSFKYRDTGKGMDEITVNKLFDPFFTTTRSKGGTGLGMHIVYNLVSQTLKGQIECKSSPGNGTEFDIIVPLNDTVKS